MTCEDVEEALKMKSKLPGIEISACFGFWFFANIFALYKLYEAQTVLLEYYPEVIEKLSDLQPGWNFLSRFKDVSDVEWSSWKFFIQTAWSYLLAQFIVTEIMRRAKFRHLRYWHIVSSMIFVILHMGCKQLLLILVQPFLYAAIVFTGGKKTSIWITSFLLLLCYNSLKYKTFYWYFLDREDLYDEEIYLLLFCIPWVELRCISFSLDYIEESKQPNNNKSRLENFADMLGYVLYTPMLYTGPIILYEDFKNSFNTPIDKLSIRLRQFVWDISIFLFYTFVLDLAQHYIYFYAMQSDIQLLRMMPTVALCGGGLWMGLQFHMKYVIAYGTTTAFARLDNIQTPPTPRCIARIHVYSQMWRYFDVGLYRFLVRYIYKPCFQIISTGYNLPNTVNKILSSFSSFFFIFMWHGTIKRIFIWSVLNYLGLTLEYICKAMSYTKSYFWLKRRILKTEAMETRLIGLLCMPLLLLSAISNFYLFAGTKVGNLFFECFLSPPYFNLNSILVSLALYCCCVTSMALEDVPSRTDSKKITVA